MSDKKIVAILVVSLSLPVAANFAHADGISAIKECETDTRRPEDTARLTIMPNGESRENDTAATLI